MHVDWTLKVRGSPIFTMPRIAVLKSMILNHISHHRAQLSVYLRINDVPVPWDVRAFCRRAMSDAHCSSAALSSL